MLRFLAACLLLASLPHPLEGLSFTGMGGGRPYPNPFYSGRRNFNYGCPICDSSVFGYCSHKLIHDSCCCGDAYYSGNSFECQYMDCGYIHANSCRESELIATCCCDDPYGSPFYSRLFNGK